MIRSVRGEVLPGGPSPQIAAMAASLGLSRETLMCVSAHCPGECGPYDRGRRFPLSHFPLVRVYTPTGGLELQRGAHCLHCTAGWFGSPPAPLPAVPLVDLSGACSAGASAEDNPAASPDGECYRCAYCQGQGWVYGKCACAHNGEPPCGDCLYTGCWPYWCGDCEGLGSPTRRTLYVEPATTLLFAICERAKPHLSTRAVASARGRGALTPDQLAVSAKAVRKVLKKKKAKLSPLVRALARDNRWLPSAYLREAAEIFDRRCRDSRRSSMLELGEGDGAHCEARVQDWLRLRPTLLQQRVLACLSPYARAGLDVEQAPVRLIPGVRRDFRISLALPAPDRRGPYAELWPLADGVAQLLSLSAVVDRAKLVLVP